MLDVIDLTIQKKIKEIELGKKPAAIFVDSGSRKIFVSNPDSNNISVLDLYDESHFFIVNCRIWPLTDVYILK